MFQINAYSFYNEAAVHVLLLSVDGGNIIRIINSIP